MNGIFYNLARGDPGVLGGRERERDEWPSGMRQPSLGKYKIPQILIIPYG